MSVDGYTPADRRDALVLFNAVSDGFFATYGTPIVAGRDFGEGDRTGSRPVAIINEVMARKFFRGADPLGQRIGLDSGPGPENVVEVVGIVGDTKYWTLREEMKPMVYLPLSQNDEGGAALSLALRGQGPATALIPIVSDALHRLNPNLSIGYATLSDRVSQSLVRERLLAILSAFFGGLVLLLAMIGIYGTMAHRVAQRRGEIGIRLALGATRARVLNMVLRDVGRVLILGVALGAIAALLATRWVATFLFGLTPSDPAVWTLSISTLIVVGLGAGALPAWRASTLNPVRTLQEDGS